MSAADRFRSLPSLLSRQGWATVLVLAGASLLVAPPDQAGVVLAGWTAGTLVAAFVLVLAASRVWPGLRG